MRITVDNEMVDDQVIIVRGVCVDVPIYVESPRAGTEPVEDSHLLKRRGAE